MNDWRYFRYRPRVAHLWEASVGGYQRAKCGRMVLPTMAATYPLSDGEQIPKCRVCLRHEVRRSALTVIQGGAA